MNELTQEQHLTRAKQEARARHAARYFGDVGVADRIIEEARRAPAADQARALRAGLSRAGLL